jgi:hypothetical protein
MASTPSKGQTEYTQMSFGDILGNALRYWISGLRYYFPLYLVVQLVMAGMTYALVFVSTYNPWIVLLAGAFVPALGLPSTLSTILYLGPINFVTIGFIGVFIVLVVINMVLQLLVTGTVIRHAADAHAGLKPSLGQSFAFARTRVVSLLGATILVTLITLSCLAAPFALIGVSILTLFWSPVLILFLLFAIFGGAVLSLVLLLYVMVRLSVFAPAVVLGGASATMSLRQSWKIVHGHFWRVFAITLIIGLIVTAIAGLPLSFSMFVILLPASPYSVLLVFALPMVFAAVNACTMPLSPLAQTMLYQDLFARYYGA